MKQSCLFYRGQCSGIASLPSLVSSPKPMQLSKTSRPLIPLCRHEFQFFFLRNKMRNKAPRKKLCTSERVDIPPLHYMIVEDSRCFQGCFFFCKDFQKINPVGRIFNLKPPRIWRFFFRWIRSFSPNTDWEHHLIFVLNKKKLPKIIIIECTRTHFLSYDLFSCTSGWHTWPYVRCLWHTFSITWLEWGLLPNSSGDWSRPRSWSRNSEWQAFGDPQWSPRIALIPNVEVIETVGQMCWNHQKAANHDDEVAVFGVL